MVGRSETISRLVVKPIARFLPPPLLEEESIVIAIYLELESNNIFSRNNNNINKNLCLAQNPLIVDGALQISVRCKWFSHSRHGC